MSCYSNFQTDNKQTIVHVDVTHFNYTFYFTLRHIIITLSYSTSISKFCIALADYCIYCIATSCIIQTDIVYTLKCPCKEDKNGKISLEVGYVVPAF